MRRFISEGGSTYARLVLGLPVRDLTGGFKCFRREVLEAIHFDGVRSQGYAFQVELTYRAVQAGFRVVEVPIVFRDRERGKSKMSWRIAAEAMWLVPLPALQVAAPAGRCRARWMPRPTRSPTACANARDASHLAANPGRRPRQAGPPARPWPPSACCWRCWIVAALDQGYQQILTLQPPFVVGDLADVLKVLESNMLVLALHAMACVAGFIAGSSLPLQAEHHTGVSRWVHEHGGRIAIGFVVCATAFSLSAQAYVIGHSLAGVSHFLRVSPALLLLGVLPHAIPELIALFLPLAAWIIASRRGEWEQLLAATVVTVAIAVPVLVIAALIEVYVSPHLFVALTHIHPPIVRSSEGWVVTVH